MLTKEQVDRLKEPMNHSWRVQRSNAYGANCVAYVDARDVEDRLDEVFGVEGWQNTYESIDGILYCHLMVKPNDEWVTKTDCGTESNTEKEKGQASDAFKRAAVRVGIGRYLYNMGEVKIPTTEVKTGSFVPSREKGNKNTLLYDKNELSAFIQSAYDKKNKISAISISNVLPDSNVVSEKVIHLIEQINEEVMELSAKGYVSQKDITDFLGKTLKQKTIPVVAQTGISENMAGSILNLLSKMNIVSELMDQWANAPTDDDTTDRIKEKVAVVIGTPSIDFSLTSSNPVYSANTNELIGLIDFIKNIEANKKKSAKSTKKELVS